MKFIKSLLFCVTAFLASSQIVNAPLQLKDERVYNQTVWNARSIFEYFEGKQEEPKLNTFASMYFSNLKENFAYNTHGTCSYVAISMLLSFYDTYFNDDFISDDYEMNTRVNNNFIPYDVESPGIKSESLEDVYGLSAANYVNYIENNYEEYLQLKLIKEAKDLFGSYKFDTNSNLYGLSLQNEVDLLNDYLHYEVNVYGVNAFTMGSSYSQNALYDEIVYRVTQGEPVIVNANFAVFGRHAVVAYDYDETTGDIYFHSGWKDENGYALSRVSLYDWGLQSIDSIVGLNFSYATVGDRDNYQRKVKNNYVPVDITTVNYVRDVKLTGGISEPTNICWKSVYNSNLFYNSSSEAVHVKVTNLNSGIALISKILSRSANGFTLSNFEKLLFFDIEGKYDAKVEFEYDLDSNTSNGYEFKREYYISNKYNENIFLTDYNYGTTYVSDSGFVEQINNNEFSFKTKVKNVALKTAGLTLAPRRNSLNEGSYIEYHFPKGISEINFDIAFNSYNDYTFFRNNNGTVLAQEFKNASYKTLFDFKAKHKSFPLYSNEKQTINLKFDEPVFKFRLFVHVDENATSNSAINGRLVIGNISIKKDRNDLLPCNGHELNFTYTESINYVCYNYALDIMDYEHNYLIVGEHCLDLEQYFMYYQHHDEVYITFDVLSQLAMEDAMPGGILVYGYNFVPIGKDEVAPEGSYKIGLVLSTFNPNNLSYHWIRQDSDGKWSHKDAMDPSTRLDAYGNLIYHPETTVFKYTEEHHYDGNEGIRFFAVSRIKNVPPQI